MSPKTETLHACMHEPRHVKLQPNDEKWVLVEKYVGIDGLKKSMLGLVVAPCCMWCKITIQGLKKSSMSRVPNMSVWEKNGRFGRFFGGHVLSYFEDHARGSVEPLKLPIIPKSERFCFTPVHQLLQLSYKHIYFTTRTKYTPKEVKMPKSGLSISAGDVQPCKHRDICCFKSSAPLFFFCSRRKGIIK